MSEVAELMSMHKLTAGDWYAYLTRHVAAGDEASRAWRWPSG
ncbi:hypothetical protein [Cellulomonas bogoriensis]|nr:hypothetical protein [Cellulomonas bogoriensis]